MPIGVRAAPARCGAVSGPTTPAGCVPPPATGTTRPAATAPRGFVSPDPYNPLYEPIRLWEGCQRRLEEDVRRERQDPELIRFRWLLEELRVSQFAQELKTVIPVSVKRLEEQWERMRLS